MKKRVELCWAIYKNNLSYILIFSGIVFAVTFISIVFFYVLSYSIMFLPLIFSSSDKTYLLIMIAVAILLFFFFAILYLINIAYAVGIADLLIGKKNDFSAYLKKFKEKILTFLGIDVFLAFIPIIVITSGVVLLFFIIFIFPPMGCIIFLIGYILALLLSAFVGMFRMMTLITANIKNTSVFDSISFTYDRFKRDVKLLLASILVFVVGGNIISMAIPVVGVLAVVFVLTPLTLTYLTTFILNEEELANIAMSTNTTTNEEQSE